MDIKLQNMTIRLSDMFLFGSEYAHVMDRGSSSGPEINHKLLIHRQFKKRFRRNSPDGPSAEGWGCPPDFSKSPMYGGPRGFDNQ